MWSVSRFVATGVWTVVWSVSRFRTKMINSCDSRRSRRSAGARVNERKQLLRGFVIEFHTSPVSSVDEGPEVKGRLYRSYAQRLRLSPHPLRLCFALNQTSALRRQSIPCAGRSCIQGRSWCVVSRKGSLASLR